QPGRGREEVQGARRRRQREHAVRQDLLLERLWHVRRSVRRALDDQLPARGHVRLYAVIPGRCDSTEPGIWRFRVRASARPGMTKRFTGTTGTARPVPGRAAAIRAMSIRRGG